MEQNVFRWAVVGLFMAVAAGCGEGVTGVASDPSAGRVNENGGNGGNGNGNGGEKITICHATGSETNPYVEITISVAGLNGHLNQNHQGLEDIVPAPAEGCPNGDVKECECDEDCPDGMKCKDHVCVARY